jgi:hypothetical protein
VSLDMAMMRLMRSTAQWSASVRRSRRTRMAVQSTCPCSYCGAPGQRVGARCEYCQVAVSKEAAR